MKLSETTAKVINLANAIRAYWETELPKRHPNYPIISPLEDSGPAPSEEGELRDLLHHLSDDEIYKLLLIMYLGRGDFTPEKLKRQYSILKDRFPRSEWAISQLEGKAPLADYLADGISELERCGIDIDQPTLVTADR